MLPEEFMSFEEIKLSRMRKVIAKSMSNSLLEMAQLTHTTFFDATNILKYKNQLKTNETNENLKKVTINDIILFAVAKVLLKHKELNSNFMNDIIKTFDHVNLGMAVDTPRGLLVPTIFGADTLSIEQLSLKSKELVNKCKDSTIDMDSLSGGSFTVSNLGSMRIEHFTPIINPPQVAILGVNMLQTRVKEEDGKIIPYQSMGLSLTYDHRIIDGAPASRFLMDLCEALENFEELVAI